MNKEVVVIGGGGYARVVIDIVERSGDKVKGLLDDALAIGTMVDGYPIIGKIDEFQKDSGCFYIIAIGSNEVRNDIVNKLNVPWYTAIHPTAIISKTAYVDEGSVIAANVVINPGAMIGKHCIVNSSSIIEHGDIIKDFVHISSGVTIGGEVVVGENSMIDLGCIIQRNIKIASGSKIKVGQVITSDLA